MTLTSGRFFNESFTTDQQACLVNESAIKNFGITDIANTRIMESGETGKMPILGVFKNFNFESLRNPIQPCIFRFQDEKMMWGYQGYTGSEDEPCQVAQIRIGWYLIYCWHFFTMHHLASSY
jgi:hypothetical protein